MSLENDWLRLEKAFKKVQQESAFPSACIFVRITELRKADNKGIDFVIRRLYASEYKHRMGLYGAPTSKYPRYPLRILRTGMTGYHWYHYDSISIKSKEVRSVKK